MPKLNVTVEPIAPEAFMRTRTWEIFVELIEALVEARNLVKENPFVAEHKRPSAGVALSMAMELYLAEMIQKENHQHREQLEPLIAQFRSAHEVVTKLLNERSRGIH